jgi:hypothetical protein
VMYPARKMSPANGRIRTARINDHNVAHSKGKVHHAFGFGPCSRQGDHRKFPPPSKFAGFHFLDLNDYFNNFSSSLAIASPVSTVPDFPPRSLVLNPESRTFLTASSTS